MRNTNLIDFDATFAWLGRHFGDQRDLGGNTKPAVFVYSEAHKVWLRIAEVGTTRAKFGKSPADVSIQAPPDFSALSTQPATALPLPTPGAIHLPDKVVHDDAQDMFVLYFDSDTKNEMQITTLLVPEKDLLDAFALYGREK